jgi:hypothetical protein
MRHLTLTLIVLAAVSGAWSTAAEGSGRLGVGVHYWRTIDEIDLDDIDIEESGLSWVASFQFGSSSMIKVQTDLEVFTSDFAGIDETLYSPQAFVLVGKSVYGGLGIGTYYFDGDFADSPFYLIRAGLDLQLAPRIYLDINGNYRFEEWKDLGEVVEEIDTDVVTLGAAVRLAF